MRHTTVILSFAVAAMYAAAVGLTWRRPLDQSRLEARKANYRIAVNDADADTLRLLPGVGVKLAERIVASRRQHGPFRHARQLLDVPGIGPATQTRLAPLIRIDPAKSSRRSR